LTRLLTVGLIVAGILSADVGWVYRAYFEINKNFKCTKFISFKGRNVIVLVEQRKIFNTKGFTNEN